MVADRRAANDAGRLSLRCSEQFLFAWIRLIGACWKCEAREQRFDGMESGRATANSMSSIEEDEERTCSSSSATWLRPESRSRAVVALLMLVSGLAGIASRSDVGELLPEFIRTYAGDTLWALALFFLLCAVFPRAHTFTLGTAAVVISFLGETSQLYQADWINAIRHTWIGGLILGFGFKWSDLVCYTVGIAAGMAADRVIFGRAPHRNPV